MIEFATLVVGAVLIVGVVYETAGIILRHRDGDGYDGRTKH